MWLDRIHRFQGVKLDEDNACRSGMFRIVFARLLCEGF
jgi:hypothetical protein